MQTSGVVEQVHQVIDRGYRELVEELPRLDLLSTWCRGLADALGLPLVALLRRTESGMLECEAASHEGALWAEMVRLPERWDGGVAGNGPASRALHAGVAVRMTVEDEGFLPWREAARDDGIVHISAAPLNTSDGAWVLLFGAAADRGGLSFRTEDAGGVAMLGCARLIEAAEKLDRQRLLSSAIGEAGNAAFVADAEGRILWGNEALSRLTGYPLGDIVGDNPPFLGSGRHGVRYYRELWSTLRSGRTWHGKTADQGRAGKGLTAWQTITPFCGADGVAHYVAIYDGSGRREGGAPAVVRARHDAGLQDQAAFSHKLGVLLVEGRAVRVGLVSARRVMGLERLGEPAVDVFLDEAESRVKAIVGTERAARVAVGEFLVLLPDDAARATMLVDALQRELDQACLLVGERPGMDIQIATAQAPADGSSLAALLQAARCELGAATRSASPN